MTVAEPEFTNFAQIRDDPVFQETLDYIFLSPGVEVTSVLPLRTRAETEGQGPYPSKEEPSDHVLLGATLKISSSL